jgi:hypothetical protein
MCKFWGFDSSVIAFVLLRLDEHLCAKRETYALDPTATRIGHF